MDRKASDREHDFTLILTGISELNEIVEDALLQACDDATLAMRSGRPYLTFSRTASSIKEAILSAIDDVRGAGVGVDVLRVDDCNLVTQSEIARKIGVTRQMVHQYMHGLRGPGGFPPPACEVAEDQRLWLWCEVANWLWTNNMVKEDVFRDAEEVDTINSVLDYNYKMKMQGELTREVVKAVGASRP